MRGSSTRVPISNTARPMARLIAISAVEPVPVCVPATAASTIRAIVSVSTVAPTALATAESEVRPASRTSG